MNLPGLCATTNVRNRFLSLRRILWPRLVLTISTTPTLAKTIYPSRPKPPPEEEIEETFLKGSGPGGQKIVSGLIWYPFIFREDPTNQLIFYV
jgi:hypothetical protein